MRRIDAEVEARLMLPVHRFHESQGVARDKTAHAHTTDDEPRFDVRRIAARMHAMATCALFSMRSSPFVADQHEVVAACAKRFGGAMLVDHL